MPRRQRGKKPSHGEILVLNTISSLEEPTVNDIVNEVQRKHPDRQWSASAIRTFIGRLEKKGFIYREPQEHTKALIYKTFDDDYRNTKQNYLDFAETMFEKQNRYELKRIIKNIDEFSEEDFEMLKRIVLEKIKNMKDL